MTDRISSPNGTAVSVSLSVVIASSNDWALLARCLHALAPQAASEQIEVIVVRASDRTAGVDRQGVTTLTPGLRWIDAPEGSTVPHLRGLGIAAARADRIALIEDDCMVAADWCGEAISVVGPAAAVGGAVEPGPYRRALDWAVYFCEYGRFMLPVPTSSRAPLPGNNVVYARWAIAALPAASRAEFREVFVHDSWQAAGVPTRVTDSLVVNNVNSWSLAHVTSGPFHHGRAYAAQRFGTRGSLFRIGIAFLTLGLPFLKVARIVTDTIARRRLAGRLALALPWILVFVSSWSAGELMGCLFGAGSSPSHWR